MGLSWREETELRKALYASMQKQKQKQHREKDDRAADGTSPTDGSKSLCIRLQALHCSAVLLSVSFSTMTLLVGRQEGHPARKTLGVGLLLVMI